MNNTEHPQLNILHCNKILSLSKLHSHSSSTSLAASYFKSMYTPLSLYLDSNILVHSDVHWEK